MSFGTIMRESMADNIYIFVAAAVAVAALAVAGSAGYFVRQYRENGEKPLKKRIYYVLDISYTFFITIISIFPLLGMFGTVKALLVLDIAGETAALKSNFFQALTSTAWGLIFAIFFKVVNSIVQPWIENKIEKAKEILKI